MLAVPLAVAAVTAMRPSAPPVRSSVSVTASPAFTFTTGFFGVSVHASCTVPGAAFAADVTVIVAVSFVTPVFASTGNTATYSPDGLKSSSSSGIAERTSFTVRASCHAASGARRTRTVFALLSPSVHSRTPFVG